MLQLAQEWASFPVPYDITRGGKTYKKGTSYYGGANKAHVSLADAIQSLEDSKAAYLDKFKNVPAPRPRQEFSFNPDENIRASVSQETSTVPIPRARPSQDNAPIPPARPSQDKITIGPGVEPLPDNWRYKEAQAELAELFKEADRTNELNKWKEAARKQRELLNSILGSGND